MNIKDEDHLYPAFWEIIKKDFDSRIDKNLDYSEDNTKINPNLICPMNVVNNIVLPRFRQKDGTIPMKDFLIKHSDGHSRRKSKKVEELIEKYSFTLYDLKRNSELEQEDYFLMEDAFEALVEDIKRTYISKNYLALMSWLIDRAFSISNNANKINSQTYRNRALLLNVLYKVNSDAFLQCFRKND